LLDDSALLGFLEIILLCHSGERKTKKGQPQLANPSKFNGSPNGNRTRVFAVRGRSALLLRATKWKVFLKVSTVIASDRHILYHISEGFGAFSV
jgi:hypothetical protein